MSNAIGRDDEGHPELTQKAIDAMALAIATAWLANAEYVYPEDSWSPDPGRQAEVAAKAAGALFLEWLMTSLEKATADSTIGQAVDDVFKDLPDQPESSTLE